MRWCSAASSSKPRGGSRLQASPSLRQIPVIAALLAVSARAPAPTAHRIGAAGSAIGGLATPVQLLWRARIHQLRASDTKVRGWRRGRACSERATSPRQAGELRLTRLGGAGPKPGRLDVAPNRRPRHSRAASDAALTEPRLPAADDFCCDRSRSRPRQCRRAAILSVQESSDFVSAAASVGGCRSAVPASRHAVGPDVAADGVAGDPEQPGGRPHRESL